MAGLLLGDWTKGISDTLSSFGDEVARAREAIASKTPAYFSTNLATNPPINDFVRSIPANTGMLTGQIGSPYGWGWGNPMTDPVYGFMGFTTPYDVVDQFGNPATYDAGGYVTDTWGNPIGTGSGGMLGYGDFGHSAADAWGNAQMDALGGFYGVDDNYGLADSGPGDFGGGFGGVDDSWGGDGADGSVI